MNAKRTRQQREKAGETAMPWLRRQRQRRRNAMRERTEKNEQLDPAHFTHRRDRDPFSRTICLVRKDHEEGEKDGAHRFESRVRESAQSA